ncbi:MAG: CPBP family intramembrane glutamic endopeptidase [Pseudoxanthomonas sp.]
MVWLSPGSGPISFLKNVRGEADSSFKPQPLRGSAESRHWATWYPLYQGPVGAISLILVGLILGWWFARTGRLWPAIIAHGPMDLLALTAYA